jgi:DNA-binding CsgD family transcriptional regulator
LHISLQTLRSVTQFVDSLADLDDPARADDLVLPGLAGLVSCDVVVYNEIGLGPTQGQIRAADYPAGWLGQADMAAFTAHVHEHPLINYINETGDDEPVKISDVLGRQQFHSLGIYADFFRPIRVEHQIGFNLPPNDGLFTAIALNRASGDFTEQDRAVLSAVAGPLNRAMHRARSRHTAHAALETAASAYADNLTDREVQVLELAAQGRTNHAIARILDVSPRTIAKHLEHIYRKLGVTSRAAAVYRTARDGGHRENPGPARDLPGDVAAGPALPKGQKTNTGVWRPLRRAVIFLSTACTIGVRTPRPRRASATALATSGF